MTIPLMHNIIFPIEQNQHFQKFLFPTPTDKIGWSFYTFYYRVESKIDFSAILYKLYVNKVKKTDELIMGGNCYLIKGWHRIGNKSWVTISQPSLAVQCVIISVAHNFAKSIKLSSRIIESCATPRRDYFFLIDMNLSSKYSKYNVQYTM